MDLSGTHTLKAPIEQIWKMILNPEVLAKITPGITELELEGDDNYKAIADIKIGPVKGRFEGAAQILDKKENESLTLKVQQNSKIGNVATNILMNLVSTEDGNTQLSFKGKADVSGLLARTGGRVMSGVANTLTKQFFENFEAELKNA